MSIIAPVKPYIKYAMELRTHVPIVAYYCKLYAVQKGLEIIKSDKSGADTANAKKFLLDEMSDLENMKKMMPEGTVKADHVNNVENFVMSVFANCDKEERTCETITKKHAQDFNRCSHFIMLLSIFDGCYDDAWEEKRKYCVYKAGTILKSLKMG
jgi:GR25 family glycosyltransferase involved in LPS biosynthesis